MCRSYVQRWLVYLCALTCGVGPWLLPYRYDLVVAPYQLTALPTAEERRRLVMQLWERWGRHVHADDCVRDMWA